jgi:hypothetical protein
MRFAAFALVVIVITDVPVPPSVSVTDGALADTFEGVPSVDLTLVVNVTVPA